MSNILNPVSKYRFRLEGNSELSQSLENINFSLGEINQVQFSFIENETGNILNLLKKFSKMDKITIRVLSPEMDELFSSFIENLSKEETSISFSYDYSSHDILKYIVKMEKIEVHNFRK
ncbi:MAG: hypothetical protein [Caudoviricetes sp.]|nr:MAG: hypothetical protein [Caudoviricetes sp.]